MKIIKTLIPTFKTSINAYYFEPMTSGENYNAFANDVIAVNTEVYDSSITLPSSGVNKETSVTITDHSGNSSVNNIQIISDIEIEGGSLVGSFWVYVLNSNFQTLNLVNDETKWKIDGVSSGAALPTTKGFVYIDDSGNPESISNNPVGSNNGLVGFDSDNSPVVMEIGDGLKVTGAGSAAVIEPNIGEGLQVNSFGEIEVSVGDGITISSGAVTLNLPAASGDVSGTYPSLTVNAIDGHTVEIESGSLADGQSLIWDSSNSRWTNATISSGGGGGSGSGFAYYLNYHNIAPSSPSGSWKEMSTTPSNYGIQGISTVPLTTAGILTSLVKFESPVGNPATIILPGGVWGLNAYLSTTATAGEAYFVFKIYTIDGTTATEVVTSDPLNITGSTPTSYNLEVNIPATTILSTTRIGIEILVARNTTGSSIDVSGYFEGTTIGYVQTSIGTPGGTGLLKTVNGILQSPSSLILDADISNSTSISGSKIQAATASNFGVVRLNTTSGDLSAATTSGYAKVAKIQGYPVSSTAPLDSEILTYSTSSSEWGHALITNSNISSTAAISGSKVNPNFGSQTVSTTGSVSTGSLSATGSIFGATINGSMKPGLSVGVIHSTGISNALTSSLIVDADIDAGASISGNKIKKAGGNQFGVVEFNTSTGDLTQTSSYSGIARVSKIQGIPVDEAAPSSYNYLRYNGAEWVGTQLESVITLIYDPSYTGVTNSSTVNIFTSWATLTSRIRRIQSGVSYSHLDPVVGEYLIIIRGDVTLTNNINFDSKIKLKGDMNNGGRYYALYSGNYTIEGASEFENIIYCNNNPSSSVTYSLSYAADEAAGPVFSTVETNYALTLKNAILTATDANSSIGVRRILRVYYNVNLTIDMYGNSWIGYYTIS